MGKTKKILSRLRGFTAVFDERLKDIVNLVLLGSGQLGCCLEEALAYIQELGPKRAYLTHLNHDILYDRESELLPENVELAYDGLVVED